MSKQEAKIIDLLSQHGSLTGLELVRKSNGVLGRGTVYLFLDELEVRGKIESVAYERSRRRYWLMSRKNAVCAAAIVVDGELWTLPRPARHCHLVNAWAEAHQRRIPEHEQGFVLTDGSFVTREQAAEAAFETGQISKRKSGLFSEDLW